MSQIESANQRVTALATSANQRRCKCQRTSGVRLAKFGYAPDARLSEGELSGLSKPLGDDVHAIVQFQRRGVEWTINLLRVKSAELEPHVYGGYAGALGARLSDVLWFVANVRER